MFLVNFIDFFLQIKHIPILVLATHKKKSCIGKALLCCHSFSQYLKDGLGLKTQSDEVQVYFYHILLQKKS